MATRTTVFSCRFAPHFIRCLTTRIRIQRSPTPYSDITLAQQRLQTRQLARIADNVTVNHADSATGWVYVFYARPSMDELSGDRLTGRRVGSHHELFDEGLKAPCGIPRHCLMQAVDVAESGYIRQCGDLGVRNGGIVGGFYDGLIYSPVAVLHGLIVSSVFPTS